MVVYSQVSNGSFITKYQMCKKLSFIFSFSLCRFWNRHMANFIRYPPVLVPIAMSNMCQKVRIRQKLAKERMNIVFSNMIESKWKPHLSHFWLFKLALLGHTIISHNSSLLSNPLCLAFSLKVFIISTEKVSQPGMEMKGRKILGQINWGYS